jgi:hypothetical protein
MQNANTWELPFGQAAELELASEWGMLTLLPVEPGQTPRLELSRGSLDHVEVQIDKSGETVRVRLDPHVSFTWLRGWECRATLFVPRDVRAHVQTNAGSVSVRGLDSCELGVKANAGKIELEHVHGLLHLAADAGSIKGSDVGGYFDVETHAGSVRLEISELRPGEHRIRATMGSVRLELARGIDVVVETHTNMGSVRNNYPSSQTATAKLVVSTEMGSVRIHEDRAVRSTWRPVAPAQPPRPPQPPVAPVPPRDDPELNRILKMVEAGELSAHDADELLRAMGRV